MRVIVYSKPECPLCDELKEILFSIQQDIYFELVEHNILEQPEAFERYRYLIPVLEIEGGPILYPPHEPGIIWQALSVASRRLT
ncbi:MULTISPECIES: glutaredoxin family protein [Caldilinea]|jgi:glutaredoxin|uniref:glutaredoxin family protein n=1 Tax=Caldilinea TaxID=233191 RepID=UPI0003137DB1|nr:MULTISPECIES: glutaredoxin family protein [Caldilinea]MBO9392902.1 glutaredoxin family protein [Caldilinea sp.]GIV74121.1 MAG: hypothetical protein KatS3mg049_2677 [Caldilinea sp.]